MARKARLEATAAPGLVSVRCADLNEVFRSEKALCVFGWGATLNANRQHFGDGFGDREQIRHGSKRPPHEIRVKPCNNHLFAAVGQLRCGGNEILTEEIRLVHPDHPGAWIHTPEDVGGVFDRFRGHPGIRMTDNFRLRVPVVKSRFEYLDFSPGDGCTPKATNQLFTFPRKHWPADYLNPS